MALTPVAGCAGVRSYQTLRDAREAVHNDPKCAGQPIRCPDCRWWHIRTDGGSAALVTWLRERDGRGRPPADVLALRARLADLPDNGWALPV